jgi:D-alanyl-D-alanine dipeptidase
MPAFALSATRMTLPPLLSLSLPCILLTLASCAGDSKKTEGHHDALVPHEAIARMQARSLVDVRSIAPDIVCDLRYGTSDNITGQPLYPEDMPCLLLAGTALKLARAQESLKLQGYGLKIWDAWRPPEVQQSLFDHGGYTGMFTDPGIMWSRHCSGTAVDVTLVDTAGHELKMPTKFDEGGPQCSYIAEVKDEEVRKRRYALQVAMMAAGFSILETEWWHFDDSAYNAGGVPPAIFAGEVGMALPPVKPPRVRRGPPTYGRSQ